MNARLKRQTSLPYVGAVGLRLAGGDFELQKNKAAPIPIRGLDDHATRDATLMSTTSASVSSNTPTLSTASSTPSTSVLQLDDCSSSDDEYCSENMSPLLYRRRRQMQQQPATPRCPPKPKRKVLNVHEQERYWSLQEMLEARGIVENRIVSPISISHAPPTPPPIEAPARVKPKASLADITTKLLSYWSPGVPSENPASAERLNHHRPDSPRSCSSHTSQEGSFAFEDQLDGDPRWAQEDEDTILYAQQRAQEWVRTSGQVLPSDLGNPFDWTSRPAHWTLPAPKSLPSASECSDEDPLPPMPSLANAATRQRPALRHVKSVSAIQTAPQPSCETDIPTMSRPPFQPVPQRQPKLLRKTASIATLRGAVTPLLTVETNDKRSLYREEEGVQYQVMEVQQSPVQRSSKQGEVVGPTIRKAPSLSSMVAEYSPFREKKLTAKQSLKNLLAKHPDRNKTLPFPVGLVLPAGGFRSPSPERRPSIPTIRIEMVN